MCQNKCECSWPVTWPKWKAIYIVVHLSQFPPRRAHLICNTFFLCSPPAGGRVQNRVKLEGSAECFRAKQFHLPAAHMHMHRNMNSGMATWHMKMYNFGLLGKRSSGGGSIDSARKGNCFRNDNLRISLVFRRKSCIVRQNLGIWISCGRSAKRL